MDQYFQMVKISAHLLENSLSTLRKKMIGQKNRKTRLNSIQITGTVNMYILKNTLLETCQTRSH